MLPKKNLKIPYIVAEKLLRINNFFISNKLVDRSCIFMLNNSLSVFPRNLRYGYYYLFIIWSEETAPAKLRNPTGFNVPLCSFKVDLLAQGCFARSKSLCSFKVALLYPRQLTVYASIRRHVFVFALCYSLRSTLYVN